MEFAVDRDGEVVIVRLSGRLDSAAVASAEQQLGAALGTGVPHLAIDMGGLDYISSAGLRVLLVLAKKVQAARGKVALCSLLPNVREVFTVSGFDSIFSIEPDTAAAVAAVR